jgi:hypothetical protein
MCSVLLIISITDLISHFASTKKGTNVKKKNFEKKRERGVVGYQLPTHIFVQ